MGRSDTLRTSRSAGFTTRIDSTEYLLAPTSVVTMIMSSLPNLAEFTKERVAMAGDSYVARFIRERGSGDVPGGEP
jgi:hypothetical protein